MKSLDQELADIHADPQGSKAFIPADAKDADMAYGIAAPGRSGEHADDGFRSLAECREHVRANVRQGILDVVLMSVSTNELLTIRERILAGSLARLLPGGRRQAGRACPPPPRACPTSPG